MGVAQIIDYTPETKVLTHPGMPTLLCRWRVSLACGCAVWIGIRAVDQEPGTGAKPCTDTHNPIMHRFNDLLALSLLHPTSRDLVDVVKDLLEEATKGRP